MPSLLPCVPVNVIKTCDGFVFTEGPVADGEGNLYFTDSQDSKIYWLDTDRRDAHATLVRGDTTSINGMAFDRRNNRLIGAQLKGNNIVAVDLGTINKDIKVLACGERTNPRFKTPHKVVLDDQGGVYFACASDMGWTGDLSCFGIYYLSPDGTVTKLLDERSDKLPRPNGIALSPDQRFLYVCPAGVGTEKGAPGILYEYPVISPGRLGGGPPRLIPLPGRSDGIAVDSSGNLYVTLPILNQVLVLSPRGGPLSSIPIPEGKPGAPITNCGFAGRDMNTLFVTSSNCVFKIIPMEGIRP
jgi:gluconolactonase